MESETGRPAFPARNIYGAGSFKFARCKLHESGGQPLHVAGNFSPATADAPCFLWHEAR